MLVDETAYRKRATWQWIWLLIVKLVDCGLTLHWFRLLLNCYTVVWPCTDSCCCWIVILYCAFLNCKSYFYLHSCLFGFCLIHVWQCWLGIKCQSQCLSEVTIFIVLSVLCAHSCLEHLSPPRFWMWEFVCIAVSVYACKYTYMREIHVQVHIYARDSCASTHTCMRFTDTISVAVSTYVCKYTVTHMCEIHLCHQHCCFCISVQVHTHMHEIHF